MNKYLYYTFIIILPVFLLILSFKFVLIFTALSPAQESWLNYFDDKSLQPEGYLDSEISHMRDVKQIMNKVDIIFYILLAFITLTLTYYKKNVKLLKKLTSLGSAATFIFVGIILLLSTLAFNSSFNYFHKIFFPQGNWQFPADSLLLQTWPIEFFSNISINIFALTLIIAAITIYISKRYIK
tara:strand:- start:40561 stop:41109 length:549 start_codon:yes stop_codon:yes gene_type:complete